MNELLVFIAQDFVMLKISRESETLSYVLIDNDIISGKDLINIKK